MIYHPEIITRIYLMVVALLIPTLSLAQAMDEDIAPTSSITLSIGTDSYQNQSRQIQLNTELENYQQISAGYGSFTSNLSTFNTAQYYAGIATNPYEKLSAGLEYSKWGQKNKLEIGSLKTDFFANFQNWSFSLSPQFNTVWLYANNDKTYNIRSKGLSVSATYYGLENYFVGVNLLQSKITDNVRFLETPALRALALRRISASAQLYAIAGLISGLEKEYQSISAGRYFNWGSIEMDWTKSKAALVDYQTETLSFIVDYQLTSRFNLSMIASQQTANGDNEALQAIDFGLSTYW